MGETGIFSGRAACTQEVPMEQGGHTTHPAPVNTDGTRHVTAPFAVLTSSGNHFRGPVQDPIPARPGRINQVLHPIPGHDVSRGRVP